MVKVRIAVAVDYEGSWNATGSPGIDDETSMALAVEAVQPGEARYWITVVLPMPVEQEVSEGIEVESAE